MVLAKKRTRPCQERGCKRSKKQESDKNTRNSDTKNSEKLSPEDAMQQKIAINIISAVAEECELSAKEYQEKFDEVTQQWEPKFATIALFISWAKHNCRHFNNNTISLVQTIADQCGIITLDLMEEVKSYRMVRAEGGNSYQMQFAKTKGQDESEVRAVVLGYDEI
ncbi:unnamed protein product [Cylindrotheca closterium]|uniref:Uncharacterized protein n=1 Tax=Cylindrotheca closterium TaxID=2856 RepID=A0AAD2CC68_9STRA|nr:unnamed protein product [Cylindrotheca closterium]